VSPSIEKESSVTARIPEEIEEYRDEHWRREPTRQIETALDAERFIEL